MSTTPLESLSSWQFAFEFQCEFPGYGWLGSEPTPQVLTSHQAQVVVQEGEVTYAVLDGEWDVLAALGGPRVAGDLPEGNVVRIHFGEEHWYEVSGDTFINRPVSGQRVWRAHAPINEPDETGAPIIRPRLTLDSGLSFRRVNEDRLVREGPPMYEWQMEDIAEGPQPDAWPWDAFVAPRSPGAVTPGYDVSRSFDRTVFWGEGTQTMTVTVTPRDKESGRIGIMVHTDAGDPFVDAVVLSYSSASGGEVSIAEGGHRSGIGDIPAELDTAVRVTVTDRPGSGSHGTITGNSVTVTNEVGTWTWQAEGDYVWQWSSTPASDVSIGFGARSVPISLLVLVGLVLVGVVLGVIFLRRRRRGRRIAR